MGLHAPFRRTLTRWLTIVIAGVSLLVAALPAAAQRATLDAIMRDTVLENGLHVVVVPNPTVPLVTIQVTIRNGAFTADRGRGRSAAHPRAHAVPRLRRRVRRRREQAERCLQRLDRGCDRHVLSDVALGERRWWGACYQLLHGDWQRAALYMDDLKRVQGTHIRSAVRKYMRNIQYVYIGNTAWIPEKEMKEY